MRIIFIGPPGSGKGTQAQRLANYIGIPHISTGEALRQEINGDSALGRSAKNYIDEGHLVPDEIVLEVVERRLNLRDCLGGFLLDGIPRKLTQAKQLQAYLGDSGIQLNVAIEFRVRTEELVRRLATRGREDDRPEIVQQRIASYQREIKPVLDYYQRRNLLRIIDGQDSTDEVFQRLLASMDRLPSCQSVDRLSLHQYLR